MFNKITYEYRVLVASFPEEKTAEINELGSQGFELFLVDKSRLFFRRITTAEISLSAIPHDVRR